MDLTTCKRILKREGCNCFHCIYLIWRIVVLTALLCTEACQRQLRCQRCARLSIAYVVLFFWRLFICTFYFCTDGAFSKTVFLPWGYTAIAWPRTSRPFGPFKPYCIILYIMIIYDFLFLFLLFRVLLHWWRSAFSQWKDKRRQKKH